MQSQEHRAEHFIALHSAGQPLILFNAWDPGSAKVIARNGASAIATGSWSVAAAFGFEDGEKMPLDLALDNLRRIVAAVDLPVTIDLEAGYADAGASAARAIEAGAVGCNIEDRAASGGLRPADEQARRIADIRAAADAAGIPFFINARTDYFLQNERDAHSAHVDAAIERGHAYAEAGANGLFVPGLIDESLIATICTDSPLPVNIMAMPGVPSAARLAALGVARISHGPSPYRMAMDALAAAAKAAHEGG